MTVVVESHGQLFGFCSQECARRFRWGEPPIAHDDRPKSFGCWLCGADLATGTA